MDGQAGRALSGAVDRVAVAGVERRARLLVHHDRNPLTNRAAVEAVDSGSILAVVMASSSASSGSQFVIRTGDDLPPIRSIDPPTVVVVDHDLVVLHLEGHLVLGVVLGKVNDEAGAVGVRFSCPPE